ncbi:hypothetical protein T459_24060 [Capsicum annuum]|uniref:NB-ARC domain-containing protein n=1 Tax=Capsicum annuum TaxID=4072 RepID=A0A2G2YUF6_CAPAN|nr:hypothetical protein T459_24060 [Capsicum annuum]
MDDVRVCFPRENNGGQIMMTSRNNEVARYAAAENLFLQMGLMSPVESWNLFRSGGFANEELQSEFATIAKQIEDKCHGLPLAIVVIAGIVKSKRIIKDWKNAAKDVKSSFTNDLDEQCAHLLGLSYNNSSNDLKACLLHFRIFPEDSEIPVEKLTNWGQDQHDQNNETGMPQSKLSKQVDGISKLSIRDIFLRRQSSTRPRRTGRDRWSPRWNSAVRSMVMVVYIVRGDGNSGWSYVVTGDGSDLW